MMGIVREIKLGAPRPVENYNSGLQKANPEVVNLQSAIVHCLSVSFLPYRFQPLQQRCKQVIFS
jgi:hypothetical protein